MLPGNKRFQRVTVGVIIGLVVLALALTLVGPALAVAEDPVSTTTSEGSRPVGSEDPKPVTETPQGTSTQVSDQEHLGGLIAYIAFMLGGMLLLIRAQRRERRERAIGTVEPIL